MSAHQKANVFNLGNWKFDIVWGLGFSAQYFIQGIAVLHLQWQQKYVVYSLFG